ncbi:hypothetical protein [Brumimicrobium salinarum]|nr:hypothetical protein [Brumimicrobium salinarum]
MLPDLHDTTLYKHAVDIKGMAFNHGNSLTNEFSRKFIFGGYIDESLASREYANQTRYNRIGGDLGVQLSYRSGQTISKKHPHLGWMLSAASNVHFSGEYADDQFGLVFLGNASFLGESVSFSSLNGRFEQFLAVGGGLYNKKTKSFVSLNVVLPQQFIQLEIDKGSIGFSDEAEQIDLMMKGEVLQGNNSPYFKGLGAAINFDYNVPFGEPDGFSGVFSVKGRNIGGYQLNKAQVFKVDVDQSFNGFSVDELVEEDRFSALKDSINGTESEISSFRLLSGFLQAGKIVSVNSDKKIQSFFGIRMYTNTIFKPLVYAGAHYQPVEKVALGAQGAFGGYGNFRLGFYASYTNENLILSIGSEDILGLFLKSQKGHSGLIRLGWKI